MNKSYAIMAGCLLMFIGGLFFLKTEMDRNRQILAQDVDQAVRDTPAKIAQDTIVKLDQALSNSVAPVEGRSEQTNDPVGSLFNLAKDVGRQVNQIGLNATELSDEEEMDFGHKLDQEILKDMPEDSDPVNLARLQTLAKNLVSQCHRKQITYNFRIVRSKTVNAFSIAGGYVYVTSAFLKRFQSDGELAMTLGHEIAHVELKHAVHKVQYEYQTQKIAGDAGSVVQLGYAVLSSPFSKDEEFAADAWGFTACKNAGWKPAQLFLLFEDLEKYQESQSAESEPPTEFERRMGQYFDSHPPTADRLARLKRM
jgi:predicted Zn-dependent protease